MASSAWNEKPYSPASDVLDVTVHARLRADSEEERGDVLRLQDALTRELCDVRHEKLLRGVRPLVDADPLLEPDEQLLPQTLRPRLHRGLTSRLVFCCRSRRRLGRPTWDTTKVVQQPAGPIQ